MTRIGNPAPGLVATPLPQGAPAAALLAELPSTLSNVALGSFLTGTVLERGANGLTLLQTANGLLGLKTTVPLPPGSTVTLQIQTAGAQLQAIVLSITPQAQGKAAPAPPQGAPLPSGPAAAVATPNPAATTPLPAASPQAASSTIVATVIGPAGGPVPANPAAQPAPTTATPSAQTAQAASAAPTPAAPVVSASPTPPTVTAAPLASSPQSQPSPATPAAAQATAPATPAVAQAAYQRQLNSVPGAAAAATPQPAPAAIPQPAAPTPESHMTPKPFAPESAPAPLPTGTQVQVRLIPAVQANAALVHPPAPDAPAATVAALVRQGASMPSHPTAAIIMATVVARTPAGQVILDSSVGRLLATLPHDGQTTEPGARLLLELVPGERAAAAPRAGRPQTGLAALARNWQGLAEAMRQLRDAPAQQDAYAALERALPKPGPKLAQQMLSYLETAQQGVKAWLGETVQRALAQTGRGPEQLERDLREMQLARQNEGDWRMTLVPLLDGQQLRQIRFFERRRKQEEEKRKKEEPARFVVECETSEHGAIQLDGLMHDKRIDLIVRSHAPLPRDMEHDILVLFGETCTGLDLAGQLFFQAVPAFPVSPLDDVAKEPVRVSV